MHTAGNGNVTDKKVTSHFQISTVVIFNIPMPHFTPHSIIKQRNLYTDSEESLHIRLETFKANECYTILHSTKLVLTKAAYLPDIRHDSTLV